MSRPSFSPSKPATRSDGNRPILSHHPAIGLEFSSNLKTIAPCLPPAEIQMKTTIPLTLLRKTKSYVSYSILLFVSVSLIASTGSTQVLHHPSSAANTSTLSDTLSATISLGAGVYPQSVVISPDSKTIYVASTTSDGSIISVVDSQTNTVTTTIPLAKIWVF